MPTTARYDELLRRWVREQLDGYLNFVHRAVKSRRDGRPEAARLDEIEAGPWLPALERVARERGFGEVLDEWDLDLMRGSR